MRFWDASALIPLCLQEPRSHRIKKLLEEDQHIIVWWGTIIECYSALARLRREKILDDGEEELSREILMTLAESWTEVEPTNAVRQAASRLLRLHPLRAADSLQLAAATVWARGDSEDQDFVCLDDRLRRAARLEGFGVIPEVE